jgi:hypothetical protein
LLRNRLGKTGRGRLPDIHVFLVQDPGGPAPSTRTRATTRDRIRKKAYRFFLRDGRIWRHPKKKNGVLLRVVTRKEEQEELLVAFHESPWAGHRGTWATFEKLKGKY